MANPFQGMFDYYNQAMQQLAEQQPGRRMPWEPAPPADPRHLESGALESIYPMATTAVAGGLGGNMLKGVLSLLRKPAVESLGTRANWPDRLRSGESRHENFSPAVRWHREQVERARALSRAMRGEPLESQGARGVREAIERDQQRVMERDHQQWQEAYDARVRRIEEFYRNNPDVAADPAGAHEFWNN